MTQLLNNLRLLIVDDDEDDSDLFIEAVEEVDERIACNTAKNGLAALEWLRDSRHTLPDLIFLDISMPLLNGTDAALASFCIVALNLNEFMYLE